MSNAHAILKATPHMYRGYHSEANPVEEKYPRKQWRKIVNQGLFTAIVRGYQSKQLLCDEQDMTR